MLTYFWGKSMVHDIGEDYPRLCVVLLALWISIDAALSYALLVALLEAPVRVLQVGMGVTGLLCISEALRRTYMR